MVLSTIGVFVAAAAISAAADKSSKKANPQLNNKEFDAKCAASGIHTAKIMDIAARCGVTPSKYGVLPEDGWKHCLEYVATYATKPDDIDNFKRDWRYVVERQLKGKSQQIIDKYQKSYQGQYDAFKKHKDVWLGGPLVVLEIKHWHGLPKDEHIQRMKDIQENTFWGELCIKDPILRHNPRFEDAHTETWVMRGTKHETDNDWAIKQKRLLYKNCCGVCGYDPML